MCVPVSVCTKTFRTIADICFLLGGYIGCRKISGQVHVSVSRVKVNVIFWRVEGHSVINMSYSVTCSEIASPMASFSS